MGTSSSRKIEKALSEYPESVHRSCFFSRCLVSKDERKTLIVSLKSSSDKGWVRKEAWIEMIKDKGVPLGLAEALWNTFDRAREGFVYR
jgi:hypothetical protein